MASRLRKALEIRLHLIYQLFEGYFSRDVMRVKPLAKMKRHSQASCPSLFIDASPLITAPMFASSRIVFQISGGGVATV
ncbi:hypothetical protein TSMEX_010742 [Taenia solium]|eukprot:TsM_000134400 transcript=TsM_000134400 gene=TsM_000134400